MAPSNALAIALLAGACTGGGPQIEPLEDQVVAVGDELSIEIHAAGEGEVELSCSSSAPDLGDRVDLARRPGGEGLFRFRPAARDVGSWVFDFRADDLTGQTTESIVIEVRPAVGAGSLPVFRSPLGAGIALDMAGGDCAEIEIVTTDQDSTSVDIAELEPRIEGAQLVRTGDLRALWRWCPTAGQRAARDLYLLTLSADDGQNPLVIRRYQIVLRQTGPSGCAELVSGSSSRVSFTPGSSGLYHVLVHGRDGAEEAYELCASLEPGP